FVLGPGTSWDQGDHKYALGFSIELPLFDQHQGPIAEAEARRSAAAARFLALQQSALGSIEAARTAYAEALRLVDVARDAAERARAEEDRARRALELGGADRLQFLDARLVATTAAHAVAARSAEASRALVALEDELQRPLARPFDPGTLTTDA